jgi:hypothetical protein
MLFFSGPKQFEHGGHHYWFSGDEDNFTDHKVSFMYDSTSTLCSQVVCTIQPLHCVPKFYVRFNLYIVSPSFMYDSTSTLCPQVLCGFSF